MAWLVWTVALSPSRMSTFIFQQDEYFYLPAGLLVWTPLSASFYGGDGCCSEVVGACRTDADGTAADLMQLLLPAAAVLNKNES